MVYSWLIADGIYSDGNASGRWLIADGVAAISSQFLAGSFLIADGVAAGLCPVADKGLGGGWSLMGGIAEGGQGPEALSPRAGSSCSSLKESQLPPLLAQLLKLLLSGSQIIPPHHLLGSRSRRPFDEATLQHGSSPIHYLYVLLPLPTDLLSSLTGRFARREVAEPSRSSWLLLHHWLHLILPWVKRSSLAGRQYHSIDLRLKSALLSVRQPCLNFICSICTLKSISVRPVRILTVNVPENRDGSGSL